MKVFSMSQRIYYKDLESEAESIIKKDLELYNCMLHKAFKICFDRAYKDVTYSETDQRMIKSFYGTSDYFSLSTIYEAKALVKSLKCREKEIVFFPNIELIVQGKIFLITKSEIFQCFMEFCSLEIKIFDNWSIMTNIIVNIILSPLNPFLYHVIFCDCFFHC